MRTLRSGFDVFRSKIIGTRGCECARSCLDALKSVNSILLRTGLDLPRVIDAHLAQVLRWRDAAGRSNLRNTDKAVCDTCDYVMDASKRERRSTIFRSDRNYLQYRDPSRQPLRK